MYTQSYAPFPYWEHLQFQDPSRKECLFDARDLQIDFQMSLPDVLTFPLPTRV